jgi:putative membrane protein
MLESVDQIRTSLTQASNGSNQITDGLKQAQNGTKLFGDNLKTFSDGINKLSNGESQLTNGLQTMSQQLTISPEKNQQLNQLTQGLPQINQEIQTLNSDLQSMNLPTIQHDVDSKLQTQLTDLKTKIENNQVLIDVQNSQLYNQLTAEQQAQLTSIIQNALETNKQKILDQIATIQSKLPLVNFSEITNKANYFATQSNTALNGAVSAINELRGGINQTKSALDSKVIPASKQLTTGVQQLQSATKQFQDGNQQIDDGLKKLINGSQTLSTKLGDGSKALEVVHTQNKNGKLVSQPLNSEHKDNDKVANNGTAMAPYMMSVALFIGAITFNVIYEMNNKKRGATFKLSVMAGMGIVQAIILYVTVFGILGARAIHPEQTLGFLVLESLTYITMVSFWNHIMGKIGAFVMLIFMILQLAGSEGTYPIQLSIPFYKVVNPFLPMTYAIHTLRSTISTGVHYEQGVIVFSALLLINLMALLLAMNWEKIIRNLPKKLQKFINKFV